MGPKELLAARVRARQTTVKLAEGKTVTITRPPEADIATLLEEVDGKSKLRILPDHVRKYVVDWSGFTEADFLEAGVGSSDPVDFDSALWADVVADSIDYFGVVAQALVDSVVAHYDKQSETAKNSVPA